MDRLTHRKENGKAVAWIYADPENPSEVIKASARTERKVFEKLAEYEDLEEQGLLIKLPCKVGDTVYKIYMDCPKDYRPEYCTDHEGSCERCPHRVPDIVRTTFSLQHIELNATIFLTREAAEKALEEVTQ